MDKNKLCDDLERDEGYRRLAYRDSRGILTIGMGRNIQQVGLSKDEARYLLGNDIDSVEKDLDRIAPWWRSMTEPRQRALANMCFNLGAAGLAKFEGMLKALESERYDSAANHALNSKWAHQVGARASRIAELIREG